LGEAVRQTGIHLNVATSGISIVELFQRGFPGILMNLSSYVIPGVFLATWTLEND